jgi:hypothetical protein
LSADLENIYAPPSRSWRGTPLLVGGVLLGAVFLKSWEGLIVPGAKLPMLGRAGQLVVELALAAACLAAWPLPLVRKLLIALFSGFALYATYLALIGAESCGCFGPVKVHPGWTIALDVVVLWLLLFKWPSSTDLVRPSILKYCRRWTAAFLAMAIPATALLIMRQPTVVASGSNLASAGELVILEPESWIGRALPIIDEIDVGHELARGDWLLLLYHHDCPQCQEALPRYLGLAEQLNSDHQQRRIAVVETPPFAAGGLQGSSTAALKGRLSDRREWFVQTPVEITLKDGDVTHVRHTLD